MKSPRKTLAAALAFAGVLIAFAGTASAQATYSIAPVAPGNCAPASINDVSSVAGSCDGTAVVWVGGTAKNLGRLAGGTFSDAAYINSLGVAVGDGDTGNGRPQSWVTAASGLNNFFPNNGGNTHALFIGENGYIGGYYTKSLSGGVSGWHGAIWVQDPKDPTRYRETDLPILPGGVNSKFSGAVPQAFNQLGQAAGYGQNDQIGQHAVFWNNDAKHSIVDLGVFGSDLSSLGLGINDAGQAVGESHPPFGSRPILWNDDAAHTAIELPLLPGDNYGSAHSINNLGQILGTSSYATPGTWNVLSTRNVIWRDGGVYDLQSLLDPVTGAGWTLTYVAGMNNLGQIVGIGLDNGTSAVFVMTPQ
ncbi:MAG TPA: hypothetical protein VHQ02_08910 [Usitatibacter sp.]|jgi:uncharacterized membrane protein|nr:hypothetical protein [Usitatibacter sp.]